MSNYSGNISLSVPEINVSTYPQGPRGTGIKSISQNKNVITVTFDDGRESVLTFPHWWFGTKDEYNSLSEEEKAGYYLHFIEEGS